tara:strand:+ start:420 stop:941 length:522 start_codon:yes stop_codon:yes gene_type:complete
MNKRIETIIQDYVSTFKTDILNIIMQDRTNDINSQETIDKLCELIKTYQDLTITESDLKKKRSRNTIPACERCNALRANGDQCTRRKKTNSMFCGTHSKGTPNGIYNNTDKESDCYEKREIEVVEYKGIPYYSDKQNRIYSHHDILQKIDSPTIIGEFIFTNDNNSKQIKLYK